MNRVYVVCSYCGSHNVRKDAFAAWDTYRQEWTLASVFDKPNYCERCKGETSIEEIKAQPFNVYLFTDPSNKDGARLMIAAKTSEAASERAEKLGCDFTSELFYQEVEDDLVACGVDVIVNPDKEEHGDD